MKLFFLYLTIVILFLSTSCKVKINNHDSKYEIAEVESAFQRSLAENGAAYAFGQFAADSAIIKRENDTLIIGKSAIIAYYSRPFYRNAIAEWVPDFIDISNDGSMAYTYGKYKWTFTDSLGNKSTYQGVFHTVWKKMKDGSWKYVWD